MLIHFNNKIVNLGALSALSIHTKSDAYGQDAEIYVFFKCESMEIALFIVSCLLSELNDKIQVAKREARVILDNIVLAFSKDRKVFNLDGLIDHAKTCVTGEL